MPSFLLQLPRRFVSAAAVAAAVLASDASADDGVRRAFAQLRTPAAWLEAAVGVVLAVVLAALIAFHPRAARVQDAARAKSARNALVLIGLIGAAAGALVAIEEAMAFVVLGVLIAVRARDLVPSRLVTARAVVVAIIGIACGLAQPVLAIVVAVAAWLAIWWLEARLAGVVKVRLPRGADRRKATLVAMHELRVLRCTVRSVREGASGRTFTMSLSVPASIDRESLRTTLESRLFADVGPAEVEVKSLA